MGGGVKGGSCVKAVTMNRIMVVVRKWVVRKW